MLDNAKYLLIYLKDACFFYLRLEFRFREHTNNAEGVAICTKIITLLVL